VKTHENRPYHHMAYSLRTHTHTHINTRARPQLHTHTINMKEIDKSII